MTANSIEIEDPWALKPKEMMTVYLNKKSKSIHLIDKYRFYNNEFYNEYRRWLEGPPPTWPCSFQFNIKAPSLFGGIETVDERLSRRIRELFDKVTYPTWVQEAFG